MADDKPKKKPQPVAYSPKGRAVYPKLSKPDFKFKPGGEYSVKLRLPEEEGRAFLAKFETLSESNHAEAVEAEKGKKDKKTGKLLEAPVNDGLPFQIEMNKETQEPTGNILITFKANASYKKDDVTKELPAPTIVDSMAKKTTAEVGGGSVIKVAFQPFPYYNDATRKAGVSFRLQGVQVIELKQFGADLDFGVEEGGYVAEEQGFQPQQQEGPSGVSPSSKGNF